MAQRISKKSGKIARLKTKKSKAHEMPDMDEMRAGMAMADEVAARQRKRGMMKKRRKARKG